MITLLTLLANSFLGPIASRCMLLSPSSRRYLKEINAFLIPCKTAYKTTRKKLKYISCWYTLRKVFSFAVTNVSRLVYRSWTMPCRFRVLAQVKTRILDRSRAAPQWKKYCFRIVARNETTRSLFFWEKKTRLLSISFSFSSFFFLPFLSFSKEKSITLSQTL